MLVDRHSVHLVGVAEGARQLDALPQMFRYENDHLEHERVSGCPCDGAVKGDVELDTVLAPAHCSFHVTVCVLDLAHILGGAPHGCQLRSTHFQGGAQFEQALVTCDGSKAVCVIKTKNEFGLQCYECPDPLVSVFPPISERGEDYGIIVHDGGASHVSIRFCPWCGVDLAARNRERSELIEALSVHMTDVDPDLWDSLKIPHLRAVLDAHLNEVLSG